MRVRTAVTAAALAASAALTLSACGGGSSKGDDKIPSASGTSAPASASPTASPSEAGGKPLKIDRSLAMPAGAKVVFDLATPNNSAQAAALSGAADFIQAIDHAVVKQNTDDPGLRGYATGGALAYGRNFVRENVSQKLTLSGTDRYFEPVFGTGGSASTVEVKLCNDQSKLYSKEVATGKVHVTGASDLNYVLWDIVMVKLPSAQAVWQAHGVTVKEKALQCKQ